MLDIALDFLNLVLGAGEETDFFWSQIIAKQALIDYDFIVIKEDIIAGGLLHAISYHCKIDFEFD